MIVDNGSTAWLWRIIVSNHSILTAYTGGFQSHQFKNGYWPPKLIANSKYRLENCNKSLCVNDFIVFFFFFVWKIVVIVLHFINILANRHELPMREIGLRFNRVAKRDHQKRELFVTGRSRYVRFDVFLGWFFTQFFFFYIYIMFIPIGLYDFCIVEMVRSTKTKNQSIRHGSHPSPEAKKVVLCRSLG